MSNYDDNFLKHFETELQSLNESFVSFANKFQRTVASGQFSRTSKVDFGQFCVSSR